MMPYAAVRTFEDVLDGSATAEIIVPTASDEYDKAYQAASESALHRMTGAAAFTMFLIGVGMWLATAANVNVSDI